MNLKLEAIAALALFDRAPRSARYINATFGKGLAEDMDLLCLVFPVGGMLTITDFGRVQLDRYRRMLREA